MLEVIDKMILHAGTSPVVSQIVLTLMLVVLGVLLVGVGFGYLAKNREGALMHRWTLSVSVAFTMGAVLLVMLPTAFRYYIDPDVEFFSLLSITTIIHGIIGFPAVVTGLIYVFGDLPVNRKKWMRITAYLWLATIALGVTLYLLTMI